MTAYHPPLADPIARTITGFLDSIGLPVQFDALGPETFLPGIEVRAGDIVVDPERLLYPGDLLHEAGHLALLSPAERTAVNGNTGADAGFEMGAIAWSWAAATHLQLDPSVLFHDNGYKGGAASLRENFLSGCYVGVPMLEWLGLAVSAGQASALGLEPYPKLVRWLRA